MADIIHRKTFMDGRMSPKDLHNAVLFTGKKCQTCTRQPEYILRSFAEEAEMLKRDPNLYALMQSRLDLYLQMRVTNFKGGPWLRIAETYACGQCFKDAQKAAAKGPSWVLVEIDHGPKEIRAMVGG